MSNQINDMIVFGEKRNLENWFSPVAKVLFFFGGMTATYFFLQHSIFRDQTVSAQGGDVIFKFSGVSYAPPKCMDPLVRGNV